jgi:hypothetical protein
MSMMDFPCSNVLKVPNDARCAPGQDLEGQVRKVDRSRLGGNRFGANGQTGPTRREGIAQHGGHLRTQPAHFDPGRQAIGCAREEVILSIQHRKPKRRGITAE